MSGSAGENYSRTVLTIVHADFRVEDNGDSHRTSRYELMNRTEGRARLVARRGQAFVVDLQLSRNYDPAIDGMSIVFTLDGVQRPQYGHGTLVASPVLHPGEVSDGAWQTVVEAYAENSLRIKVSLVDCFSGPVSGTRIFFPKQIVSYVKSRMTATYIAKERSASSGHGFGHWICGVCSSVI